MKGFRDFLLRGNLLDLAIAFILGIAFQSVVQAFAQIIMDVVGLIGGRPDFSTVTIGPINVGRFITAAISFLLMAFIIYFCVVRPYQKIRARMKQEGTASPTSEDLLTEIRDLLRSR